MTDKDLKKEIYSTKDICDDYDAGLSLEFIAKRLKMNREVIFKEKITIKKAYKEVCSIVYELIMKRGSIVKRS